MLDCLCQTMLDDDFGLTLKLYECFQKFQLHRPDKTSQPTQCSNAFVGQLSGSLPQRYYAYLLQFDSNVKNPSVIVVILPGFFGEAVFLLTVFHCIIFCIDFDMFMSTSFVPTLYCYLSQLCCFLFFFFNLNFRTVYNRMYQLRQMKFFLLFTAFGVVLSASEYLMNNLHHY